MPPFILLAALIGWITIVVVVFTGTGPRGGK